MSLPFFIDELILLSLLGGLLAVDERVGWQSLLSQPLFAGAVVGLLLGNLWVAVRIGTILELVWLSVMPMRATRRPDGVMGAIVGAGTACLLLKHTGDPGAGARFLFVESIGVLFGLITGELSGWVGRWAYSVREHRLGGFIMRGQGTEARLTSRLSLCSFYSAGFYFIVQAGMIFILVPVAATLGELITAVDSEGALEGGGWWLELAWAVGAASLIHLYWQKHVNRYLILFAGIVLVLLWFK